MAPPPITSMKLVMDLGSEARSLPALEKVLPILLAPSEEPESPLNNALSLAQGSESERKAEAGEILLRHLNRSETSLVLLDGKDNGRGFQPERGESTADNWVFSLVLPSLSDHIYWVVIPKKPQTASLGYVYGFN